VVFRSADGRSWSSQRFCRPRIQKPFDDDGQVDVFGREAGLVNAFSLAASGASALRENTTRHPFVAIPATHMKWSDTTTRARAHLLTHVRLVERFES